VRASANELPVPRKPGESLQDWQQRGAALQARYAFAKVALDRGDFAAAAGGFAALLLEEPGFLDAPQLLVKAREGLRAAAADALESGNKLDAAGDWVSALRRYEQAREIDRAVPGLEEAIKRVRDKMHTAGLAALRRARQFDALGRFAEALSEYEKAAQWLSPDDPNQQIAKGRADQLKARLK
jgi:tetratricopeptide (TPR) repeat protein